MDGGVKCYLCGNIYSGRGTTRHLKKCIDEKYGMYCSESAALFLIKVTTCMLSPYCLYLLADGCVLLGELDSYLRKTWLECCGHLSSFYIHGITFDSDPQDDIYIKTECMDYSLASVIEPGDIFSYTYDFGSSTNLDLTVVEQYTHENDREGIRLAARNLPCGNSLINSPRKGICGYCGPSDDILFMSHDSKAKQDIHYYGETQTDSFKVYGSLLRKMAGLKKPALSPSPNDRKCKSMPGDLLADYLYRLNMNELNRISGKLNIKEPSRLKKVDLVSYLNDFIFENMDYVLPALQAPVYDTLMELLQKGSLTVKPHHEIPLPVNRLCRTGLVFAVTDESGCTGFKVPSDLRQRIEEVTRNQWFHERYKLCNKIEDLIFSVFFYWGIARKIDIYQEIVRFLTLIPDEDVYRSFDSVFAMLEDEYMDYELSGRTRYYNMFAQECSVIIAGSEWAVRDYPHLKPEMVPEHAGWTSLMLLNPYFRRIHDLLLSIAENSSNACSEGASVPGQEVLPVLTNAAGYVMNTRPDNLCGQKLTKLLPFNNDDIDKSFLEEAVNGIMYNTSNYWLRGNTISGKPHVVLS